MNVRVLLLVAGPAEELEVMDRHVGTVPFMVYVHFRLRLVATRTTAVLLLHEQRDQEVSENLSRVVILLSIGGSHGCGGINLQKGQSQKYARGDEMPATASNADLHGTGHSLAVQRGFDLIP
jgi:hypothetical protein